jgi:hypothetical protein
MDQSPTQPAGGNVATFRVHAVRDPTGSAERMVWCVSHAGREMGRFPSAEPALRAAMAYARAALQKGELQVATVTRERGDGTDVVTHLAAFR